MGNFRFLKPSKNPLNVSDAQWLSIKILVKNLVLAHPKNEVPFEDIITAIRMNLPAGWKAADITEGLLKQVAQDENMPHI